MWNPAWPVTGNHFCTVSAPIFALFLGRPLIINHFPNKLHHRPKPAPPLLLDRGEGSRVRSRISPHFGRWTLDFGRQKLHHFWPNPALRHSHAATLEPLQKRTARLKHFSAFCAFCAMMPQFRTGQALSIKHLRQELRHARSADFQSAVSPISHRHQTTNNEQRMKSRLRRLPQRAPGH